MKYRPVVAAVFAVVFLAVPAAWASTWQIDPVHSSAQFSIRHLMVSNVRGEFSKVTGAIVMDEKDILKSTIEATIDATTINTREPARDKDLKSPNFLDVEKHPAISFKSKGAVAVSPGRYKVRGDLTLHGVTREVVLDVEGPTPEIKDPWGNIRRGASASTRINRKDFGVTYNKLLEAGGAVVGDEVTITIDVELVMKAAPAAKSEK